MQNLLRILFLNNFNKKKIVLVYPKSKPSDRITLFIYQKKK